MAVAAAAEAEMPLVCLNGYEYKNQPLIHSLFLSFSIMPLHRFAYTGENCGSNQRSQKDLNTSRLHDRFYQTFLLVVACHLLCRVPPINVMQASPHHYDPQNFKIIPQHSKGYQCYWFDEKIISSPITNKWLRTKHSAMKNDSTWNCLPVAGQDENSVTLLDITGAGTMQNVYYSMAVAAAAEAEVPLVCLNGYEYKNQPLIHSLQAHPLPQIFLMNRDSFSDMPVRRLAIAGENCGSNQ